MKPVILSIFACMMLSGCVVADGRDRYVQYPVYENRYVGHASRWDDERGHGRWDRDDDDRHDNHDRDRDRH